MNKQRGFTFVEGLIIVLILSVVGSAGYIVWNNNQDDEVTNKITVEDVETIDSSQKETIEIENRGTYTLQEPTDKVVIYDISFGDPATYESAVINKTQYVTIDIPLDWKVYEKALNGTIPELGGLFVETNTGKYIHLDRVDGVGGECPTNADTYTLTKKLSTKIPNSFFTQYDTPSGRSSFALEKFDPASDVYKSGSFAKRHFALEEGDANTDTCNLFGYSFVAGSIYITVSDSNKFELGSDLTWDDIEEDEVLIEALQSLNSFGYN